MVNMKSGSIPGVEKPVSRLAQGTMMIGTSEKDRSFALLDSIFELGGNMFDTAHVYGGGDCERCLGEWINNRGIRDKVVIIGKGAHHNQDRNRVTPYDISSDLHDSLARLQVDYIDIYMLHRDDPSVPVGPIVEVLNEHVRAGLIKAFGGSNWTDDRLQEANRYARAHGLIPFTTSSPQFSLAEMVQPPWRECVSIGGADGAKAREWYAEEQLAVIPWSSLASGFFSGRFSRDGENPKNSYFDELCVRCYCYDQNFDRLDRAKELATKRDVTLPQIALAFVLCQPMNIFPLVGCATKEEFAANAEALEIELTPNELDWLDLKTDQLL
jgi:aryl-alcohol dehydrogenase-like predicted oxidoreductase